MSKQKKNCEKCSLENGESLIDTKVVIEHQVPRHFIRGTKVEDDPRILALKEKFRNEIIEVKTTTVIIPGLTGETREAKGRIKRSLAQTWKEWIASIRNFTEGSSKASSKPQIIKAPGTRLFGLVDFLFSPKTVEQTFKPLIADWRYEYFEALKQEHKWKARWISTHYRFSFIMAMGLSKVFSLLKQWKSASK